MRLAIAIPERGGRMEGEREREFPVPNNYWKRHQADVMRGEFVSSN